MNEIKINRSAPNLIVLCIDHMDNGDVCGTIVHRYSKEPIVFTNSLSMFRMIEEFYDEIDYPQTTERIRNSFEAEKPIQPIDHKKIIEMLKNPVRDIYELLQVRGENATFLLSVTSRVRATWQGKLVWLEEEKEIEFISIMEIWAIIGNTMERGMK